MTHSAEMKERIAGTRLIQHNTKRQPSSSLLLDKQSTGAHVSITVESASHAGPLLDQQSICLHSVHRASHAARCWSSRARVSVTVQDGSPLLNQLSTCLRHNACMLVTSRDGQPDTSSACTGLEPTFVLGFKCYREARGSLPALSNGRWCKGADPSETLLQLPCSLVQSCFCYCSMCIRVEPEHMRAGMCHTGQV